jgi:MFS family permease
LTSHGQREPLTAEEKEERSAIRHNIRVNNRHGVWESLALNLYSPFLGLLAIRLGAGNLQVALISALPAAVSCVASFAGAALLKSVQRKRQATCGLIIAHRAFLLAIAVLPLVPDHRQAWVLVGLVALMNVPGAVGHISWQSLMGDTIPAEFRGDAFAARSRLVTAVGIVPALLGGYLFDSMPFPIGYQLVFVAAFLASLVEVKVLSGLREPARVKMKPQPQEAQASQSTFAEVMENKAYVSFTLKAMLFYFGWMMSQPLFTIYYVRVLNCGSLWVAVFSVVSSIARYVSFPRWSRYAGKKGNAWALAAATAGMALTPLMVAVSPWAWLVAVFNVSMGYFTSGTTLLMLNTLLEMAPEKNRTSFIAYHNSAVNLSSFIGPLVGKALVDWFDIYWALGISAAIRAAGSIAFFLLARKLMSQRRHVDVGGRESM